MAREGLRGHLSGSVPISIGFHLVLLLVILIIPLTAVEVRLPEAAVTAPEYMRVAPMPLPPEVVLRSASRASTRPSLGPTAPTVAPGSIKADVAPASFGGEPAIPDAGAVDPGIGRLPAIGTTVVMQPPPVPRPPTAVRVADLPVAPRKEIDVRPAYPEAARAARIEGTVLMEAVIDPSGRVTQLRVIKSVPFLDAAALEAVRQWRYTPSVYGGHPVSVLMTITIRFTLQ